MHFSPSSAFVWLSCPVAPLSCHKTHRLSFSQTETTDSGDYVNSLTHNSETAIYFAAKNGHTRSVRLLLKVGADVNLKTHDMSCPLFAGESTCQWHQCSEKLLESLDGCSPNPCSFPYLSVSLLLMSLLWATLVWKVVLCLCSRGWGSPGGGESTDPTWSRGEWSALRVRLVLSTPGCIQGELSLARQSWQQLS